MKILSSKNTSIWFKVLDVCTLFFRKILCLLIHRRKFFSFKDAARNRMRKTLWETNKSSSAQHTGLGNRTQSPFLVSGPRVKSGQCGSRRSTFHLLNGRKEMKLCSESSYISVVITPTTLIGTFAAESTEEESWRLGKAQPTGSPSWRPGMRHIT